MYYHSFILDRARNVTIEGILHMAIRGLGPADLRELARRLGEHVARVQKDAQRQQ
jgi:hypothetical protein